MVDPGANIHLRQRSEEFSSSLDGLGNFETQHCARRWDASLYRPILDRELVEKASWREAVSWPEGKRFAACLTHDVDTGWIYSRMELLRRIQQHIQFEESWSGKIKHLASFTGMRHSPGKTDIFSPWVEAERKHGFQSTFFFFASDVRERHVRDNVYRWKDPTWYRGTMSRVSDVTRDLDAMGWEIGLHGSFLTYRSVDMMRQQKEDIERFMQGPIISARQHNLHFDAKETPRVLEEAGILVDSTLGFNRDVGFRAGTSYPYPLWDASGERWLNLMEIPLILHDCALLRRDNLDLDCESAYRLCTKIIDDVAAVRGVVTLLWHPESYVKPGWFELYERLLKYISDQNGWGASAAQIYRWWTSRGLNRKMQDSLKEIEATAR